MFDKAKTISKEAHTTEFEYGPDRKRFRRVDTGSAGTQYTLYVGSVEIITRADGSPQVRRTIGGIVVETEKVALSSTIPRVLHQV